MYSVTKHFLLYYNPGRVSLPSGGRPKGLVCAFYVEEIQGRQVGFIQHGVCVDECLVRCELWDGALTEGWLREKSVTTRKYLQVQEEFDHLMVFGVELQRSVAVRIRLEGCLVDHPVF